jgi:hypothetical protein
MPYDIIVDPNELIMDMAGMNGRSAFAMETRQTDPNILPQPYATPSDYNEVYPIPVPTDEIVAMCEELSMWQSLTEEPTQLKTDTWRELNELAFTSGSSYIGFADGSCPEEFSHDGSPTTITLKNLGAKKTLSYSDIMDSAAKVRMGQGIGRVIGGLASGQGMPGGSNIASFDEVVVMDVKAREMRYALTLVLNGWDRLLVKGNATTNPLEFDGVETRLADPACSVHANSNTASGTFSATAFNQFLAEGCARPTALFGAPQAIQEMLTAYFSLGFNGSQLVNYANGDRIVPGFNFAGFVNTGIGRMPVVADNNFTKTNIGGGNFQAKIYALRMNHGGIPLVYKRTQIPLSMHDLVPGCTAISFQAWVKTALVIKHCCAHGVYTSQFTGRIVTTCPVIG